MLLKTRLNVYDNSGAKTVQCIRKTKNRKTSPGSFILVTVNKLRSKNRDKIKLKKGAIFLAQVIRISQFINRKTGLKLKIDSSGVILLNRQQQPIGSRIFGIVFKELRLAKHFKTVTLSGNFI
jgi:large subunit ribosomal protein L14